MRQVDNWEVTPTRDGVSALTGEGAEQEVPENVQADLRKRAEQEGGPVSASASVRFSHDLVTRKTDSRVNVPQPRPTLGKKAGRCRELSIPDTPRYATCCRRSSSSPGRPDDAAGGGVTT